VFDATVVPVLDVVPELVLVEVFVLPVVAAAEVFEPATVAVDPAVPIPCERSIIPEFGATRLATESDAVEVAAALPASDSLPQAARVRVARVHRRTLRI
jgi:hypothetical protein